MRPFHYEAPASREEAAAIAASHLGTQFLGGGTSLVDLMKLDVMRPETLVDLRRIPLEDVTMDRNGLRIGARVRNSTLAEHPLVREHYSVLSQALLAGASPQLRNVATVGGNLMQRTRCPYFRDLGTRCNKREPGSGCDALDGENRSCAVLGTSESCLATHPSDMCVALAMLGATVHTFGPRGERAIPFLEFHLLPEDHPEQETVLSPGELIVAVSLPPPSAKNGVYLKVRDRASYAFALVSVAASLDVGDTILGANIALGGVGTKPWRATNAEKLLVGTKPSDGVFADAAERALEGAIPRRHNAFKIELAKRTIVRALQMLTRSA